MPRKQRAVPRRVRIGPQAADFADLLELEVGPPAHGGHCVCRHEGRVVFVRHALPGERVTARVTSVGGGGRFLRADVVAVLVAAPGRGRPPCPWAGSCGGCDWQHAALPVQRDLKAQVVSEALSRALGRPVDVTVEQVGGDDDGLGWRTRVRLAVSATGVAGLHPTRSHEVVPIGHCAIAHPGLELDGLLARAWPGRSQITVETDAAGRRVLDDEAALIRTAAGRSWQVPPGGFWQVHPGAPDALVDAVRTAADVRPGDRVVDLYAGVGLMGGALAGQAGPTGTVDLVESGRAAAQAARSNLADLPNCRVSSARVEDWLGQAGEADVVILDPPRSGAGAAVVAGCLRLTPRVIVYVACDPVALARDAATLAAAGWVLVGLRAFDLFPMTHHVECVAEFRPYLASPAGSNS